MATNLALLSIALGDVRGARKLLAPLRTMPPDANVEALAAAALAKEGRRDEALLVLAEAETQLGRVDVLDSFKGYVITGKIAPGAHAALTGDPVAYAELAASKIRFTNLDAASQANIMHLGPDPLLRLIVESVRAAGSRTTSLVPSLRNLGADTKEDDVTAVFGSILDAVVSRLGWHVAEQSRGGLTAAGGPGERDLTITKDGSVVAVVEAVACRLPLTHG